MISLAHAFAGCLALVPQAGVTDPAQHVAAPHVWLEARTAAAVGAAVGDTVRLSALGGAPRAFVVAGTYRRPADPSTAILEDDRAILHLPDLQALLAHGDRVDRFTLRLAPGADGDSVRAEIERRAYGVEAYASSTVAAATSETFRVISRFHRALAGITIVGSSVFLLCLVVLKIGERRREGAAMREIGLSRRTLFLWAFAETCVMAVAGTAAGLLLGAAGAALINAYFQRTYGTSLAFARVTPDLAVEVAAIGLVLGAGIGLWAGRRMVRTAPARLREP